LGCGVARADQPSRGSRCASGPKRRCVCSPYASNVNPTAWTCLSCSKGPPSRQDRAGLSPTAAHGARRHGLVRGVWGGLSIGGRQSPRGNGEPPGRNSASPPGQAAGLDLQRSLAADPAQKVLPLTPGTARRTDHHSVLCRTHPRAYLQCPVLDGRANSPVCQNGRLTRTANCPAGCSRAAD